MEDRTIIKVTVQSSNNYSGIRFWELKCERKDGNFNRFNLKVNAMQEKGVTKTLNGTRKVSDWLNSREGLDWINKNKEDVTNTGLGMFL